MNSCKECNYLTKTRFNKKGLDLYYCNCLQSKEEMEKTTDFKICGEFIPKVK